MWTGKGRPTVISYEVNILKTKSLGRNMRRKDSQPDEQKRGAAVWRSLSPIESGAGRLPSALLLNPKTTQID
jgi:hypothetical protein